MKTCRSCRHLDWNYAIPRCREYGGKSLSLDVDYCLMPLKECLRDQEQEALLKRSNQQQ